MKYVVHIKKKLSGVAATEVRHNSWMNATAYACSFVKNWKLYNVWIIREDGVNVSYYGKG